MKANELRIGNLLFDNLGRTIKISEVRPEHLVFHLSNGNKIKHTLNSFKPIPLTEEWLLKFGFEIKEIQMLLKKYKVWMNFSFYLDINDIEKTFFYNWMGGNQEIKYVHQLQNLYFALTGKELILNNYKNEFE